VHVGVLGPVVAWRDGRRLELGPYRQRAVLAVLATHANAVVSLDRLVDQAWGGAPPTSAVGTLQAYVSNLRRALEPGRTARAASILMTEAPGYALRVESSQLDALRFEELLAAARSLGCHPEEALASLDEALGLWRGPPLAEFEHEDFASAWRVRLGELRADAVEMRVALLLELGRVGDAVVELTGAVMEWPLRERFRAQQVLALARLGRQAEALRAYEAARRFLAEELGLSPGSALEAAYEKALSGDQAAASEATATTASVGPGSYSLVSTERSRGRPTGIVTFLLTDVEGSTQAWEAQAGAMDLALRAHDAIVTGAVNAAGGYVFSTAGDSFAVAFSDAAAAVSAAVSIQRLLGAQPWPDPLTVRVRIGLHTGHAVEREGDYFGPAVNRTARLMAAAHGAQIVCSALTAELARPSLPADVRLHPLGPIRLPDLLEPIEAFGVAASGLESSFPPLRSLDRGGRHNLPVQRNRLVGRVAEAKTVATLLTDHRLVTLTGVGGCGKTRLALAVATEMIGTFDDGVYLVELAPVTENARVADVVANAVNVAVTNAEDPDRRLELVSAFLARRQLLLVLDNCEHLLDAVAELIEELLSAGSNVRVVATSREPLAVAGEHVHHVRPLPVGGEGGGPAVELFVERSAEVDDNIVINPEDRAVVAEVCR
jgi:DNA-binding SARP family transcriptional activator